MLDCAVDRKAQMTASIAVSRAKQEAGNSHRLASFPPGYFALVMATGIVSLATHYQGSELVARVLFWLNLAAYFVLWGLTLIRFIRYRTRLIDDLTHHPHGAAFLTVVAGTCLLGCQFAILTPWIAAAEALWVVGVGLWTLLIYTFLTVVTVRNPKPPLEAGINGGWLLVVVATEAISVLGTLIAPFLSQTDLMLFVSLAAALVGTAFYVFFITLILYRWMFFRMQSAQLTPDYWINMGALAIATLSGTLLRSAADRWNLLQELTPFLMGGTLLCWATATWWIPLLVIVTGWRHWRGRVPLAYHPGFWSLVFPLGMYSVATAKLAEVTGLLSLDPIAAAFAWLATIAWGITFFGLIRSLTRKFWQVSITGNGADNE